MPTKKLEKLKAYEGIPEVKQINSYSLKNKIGQGMFGSVWLAEKRTLAGNFEFAIKLFPKESVELDKIQQEIAVWKLASGHQNILTLIEADIYEEYFYIVSQHISDGSLQEILNDNDKKLPLEKIVVIIKGILTGLEHLHVNRVIHRDLKPANILLQGETPKLADFGVSRLTKNTLQSTNVSGTYSYMPPEAFEGKFSEKTDLWAVGVIFYQLLTGSLPFPQKTIPDLLGAIIFRKPEALPSEIPIVFQEFLNKAFQKNPDERFSSAQEMKNGLILAENSLNFFSQQHIDILQDSQITQIKPRDEFSGIIVDISRQETESKQLQPTIQTNIHALGQMLNQHNSEEVLSQFSNKTERSNTKFLLIPFLVLLLISIPLAVWAYLHFGKTNEASPNIVENTAPTGMIHIQGGEFEVGRKDGDDYEKPTYKTKVAPFFIDVTEVTREAYKTCVDNQKCDKPANWKDGGFPKRTGLFPMTGLSWDQAKSYCEKNDKRLPTEEEWEFAARGTDGRIYPWGNDWKTNKANIANTTGALMSVKSFQDASPFGLYDMVGNSWEWTNSILEPYPNGKLPDNLPKEELRVIRGGSFESGKEQATVTYRRGWYARNSSEGYENTGFRCAK